MSSLVRSCMELRNIFLRGWGTLKTAAVYHARLRTAHFAVQRIACGPLIAAALTYHAEVRCSTAVGQGPILRHVGAAAGKEVQAIPCGTFLYRGCNQTKGNPKTVGFWRRFCILSPPRAKGCRAGAQNIPAGGKHADAGAARNRRTKNGPSGRQPLRGARPKPRETTRARGAEYLFYILPQKRKRLQRKVSFSRRGSLYLDRRRVSAPLPAACYQLSCVLYWATIRQIGSCGGRLFI